MRLLSIGHPLPDVNIDNHTIFNAPAAFDYDAIAIDPEVILVGVLPPLLYSAAVQLPAIEFRRDFAPIAGLSVLLVVLSSVGLGLFFWAVIPGLGPFHAFVICTHPIFLVYSSLAALAKHSSLQSLHSN